MEVILTIDIGTSSVKIATITPKGKLVKFLQTSYPTHYLKPNNLEQEPEDWWDAVKFGIYQILKEKQNTKISKYSIIGIACCGHSPTLVCVNKQGKILRPAIIWQDSRAFKEVKYIKERLKEEFYSSIMISPLTPSSRIAKLIWLKNNEPGTMKKVYTLFEPKDYINFRLTGESKTSFLSGRDFVDVKTGKVHSELLNRLEIPESIIPKAVPSHSVIGTTTKSLEDEIGLPKGIPVIAGEMDSITSIVGTGITKKNMCYNISGTSEIIGISIDQQVNLFRTKKQPYFGYPFYNNLQIIFEATQASGKSIDWYIKNIIGNDKKQNEMILKNNKNAFTKFTPLVFLPYIEGERSPIWDSSARGIFFGLNSQHSRFDLYRAILEGIGFSILQNFEILRSISNKENIPDYLRVSGGGAENNYLNQIKADILGKEVIKLKVYESGLLGGAILAMMGLKIYSFNEAAKEMVHIDRIFQPNMEKHYHHYSRLFLIYKKLYQNNLELFKELGEI
ncbi:MAG: FGGY family carbohydrate kinase [Candidatus Nealsonbacteria bacterium]